MRKEFKLVNGEMTIRGYYDIEKGDALLFYNFNDEDIGTRFPINPFNRRHEFEKHKCFEKIKEGVMRNYNTLKFQIKNGDEEIKTKWYTLKVRNEE